MVSYELLHEVSPVVAASPSRSAAYVTAKFKDFAEDTELTLYDTFENSCEKFADNACIGYRPKDKNGNVGDYTFFTYKETNDKVKAFASGLKASGVERGKSVAVFGANSCEWMIAMQACNRMSYTCVPLYDTLGENAIEYILNHSEATFVVVSAAKLAALAKALPKVTSGVKGIVYWGKDAPADALSAITATGAKVTPYEEYITSGALAEVPADPPKPTDLCTIMYTSGTTGDPKGVMITHSTVVNTVRSQQVFLKENNLELGPSDRVLSYLPLAHIFDRVCEETFLSLGGSIGYWQGLLPELLSDIGSLKPTLFIGVPRVFDRISTRIKDKVAASGCLKSMLFNWASSGKLQRLKAGFSSETAAPFWDKIVFSKIKSQLGGCVRAIISGGAPLAPHVEEFLKVAMCSPVVQGYGLTESCAASFIAMIDDWGQHGTIGPPQPVTTFCLESVPDMNYDATGVPARGELLLKGPNNFKGYFKDQVKTDEVLEADGWFHTGDVAEIQPNGTLKIIDRKKNIFKLSQGEYVAVEKLEGEYKKCPAVDQIWVYGNSFESCLIAVVVPNKPKLEEWAKGAGKTATFEELCEVPEAATFILDALKLQAKESSLKGFEVVKAVHLDPEEFSIANDLITPTFKLRRPQLLNYYKEKVDALYTNLKTA